MKISEETFHALVEETLEKYGYATVKVSGISMRPMIPAKGGAVLIEKCTAAEIKPHDLVFFKYRDRYVFHRFLRKEGDTYIMRGDNVFTHCETCKADDILGRVVSVKSGRGTVNPTSRLWIPVIFLWRIKGRIRSVLSNAKRM